MRNVPASFLIDFGEILAVPGFRSECVALSFVSFHSYHKSESVHFKPKYSLGNASSITPLQKVSLIRKFFLPTNKNTIKRVRSVRQENVSTSYV